jgi:hypothetical protein
VTAETTIPAIGTKSGRPGECAFLLLRTAGMRSTNGIAPGCMLKQLTFSGHNNEIQAVLFFNRLSASMSRTKLNRGIRGNGRMGLVFEN